jgi:hypothetical protein
MITGIIVGDHGKWQTTVALGSRVEQRTWENNNGREDLRLNWCSLCGRRGPGKSDDGELIDGD